MTRRRLVPDSILGWLALILIAGVIASQALTTLLHNANRNAAILEIEDRRAAERIATFALFLQHTAPFLRESVAGSMSGPSLSVSVGRTASAVPDASDGRIAHLSDALAERLKGPDWREVLVSPGAADAVHAERGLRDFRVSIALRDGDWINFAFPAIDTLPLFSPQLLVLMIGSILAVLGLSFYAVLRVTRPLERLTRAAEELGRSGRTEILPESGASEVRRAARAFNEMQGHIKRLIDDRLQMTAAISHDLRTPITRLKLRAEFVEDPLQREKMLRDLDEMEAMIKSTLALAREDANPEPRAAVDLGAMLADCAEGLEHVAISIGAPQPATLQAQPLAMKRALGNLIENAVKFGKTARVRLDATPGDYVIAIDDDGPGISSAEIEAVFRPFYRVEASRNRESGGAGLGLAIARSVIRSHGGDIHLENRPEGGLRARITLPR
jgi:signal transduction histidine kinase